MNAVRALTYLKRYGPMEPYFKIDREGDAYEDVLRPDDHERIVRMALETEGPRSAEIVRFWIQEQPGAFHVYRSARTGELVAFMLWLRLTDPEVGVTLDPVVAGAWDRVRELSPLLPGQHFLLYHFLIYPQAYGTVSSVGHLMQLRICCDWIRSRGLAWSFITSPDAALWGPLMDHLGHEELFSTPWDKGRTFTTFGCDWRVTPLEIWFDQTSRERSSTRRPRGPRTTNCARCSPARSSRRPCARPCGIWTGPRLCVTAPCSPAGWPPVSDRREPGRSGGGAAEHRPSAPWTNCGTTPRRKGPAARSP
ncbi:hypothetical protein SFUMM280S_03967 [Streptomyces fumanus]